MKKRISELFMETYTNRMGKRGRLSVILSFAILAVVGFYVAMVFWGRLGPGGWFNHLLLAGFMLFDYFLIGLTFNCAVFIEKGFDGKDSYDGGNVMVGFFGGLWLFGGIASLVLCLSRGLSIRPSEFLSVFFITLFFGAVFGIARFFKEIKKYQHQPRTKF